MDITVEIAGVDRTDLIMMGSLSKEDIINDRVDRFKFSIQYHPGQLWRPDLGDEIEVMDGLNVFFRGIITEISETREGAMVYNYVECGDYSVLLNRKLVAKQYKDKTVDFIIADILTDYAPDFTDNNVDCPIEIKSITFNRITVFDTFTKLAELTGYKFYVDYDMDVHFNSKASETAPFSLTDDSGNYIPDSLELSRDLSQLRNRVYVEGGEAEGLARSELFDGDGVKKVFKLGNKYSGIYDANGVKILFVEVGGVDQNIGIDFLDAEADFDVFWNFEQKYLRFKDSTVPPAGSNNVEVTGLPLFPILVVVEEPNSIAEQAALTGGDGIFEHAIVDRKIKSREEAKKYAVVDLQEHKDQLVEGSFQTYTSGLRSGMLIQIQSNLTGRDEEFLIQRVKFSMISKTLGVFTCQIASSKTIGIVDYLIKQLKQGDRLIDESGDEVLDKISFASETIEISETIVVSKVHNPQFEDITITDDFTVQALNFGIIWVAGDVVPNGFKRTFIVGGATGGSRVS